MQGQPVSWKGHYYGRNGESLGALNDREFDIIRMQNKSFDWSAQIIPAATLGDLSKEAIDFSRNQYIEKNTIDLLVILSREHGTNHLKSEGKLITELTAHASIPILVLC